MSTVWNKGKKTWATEEFPATLTELVQFGAGTGTVGEAGALPVAMAELVQVGARTDKVAAAGALLAATTLTEAGAGAKIAQFLASIQ